MSKVGLHRSSDAGRAGGPRRAGAFGLLSLVLFAIALVTSRVMLVLHEWVGHGLTAVAVGGQITGHRLFFFGGGFVSYRRAEPFSLGESLLVSLGGIGVELLAGGLALLASRRATSVAARVALAAFALAVLVHAGFYLITGTHHVFGDGRALAKALGGARPVFVAVASGLLIGAGYALASRLTVALGPWLLASTRGSRLAWAAGAAGLATALHGGLMQLEQVLRTEDATYGRIMRPAVVAEAPFPLREVLGVLLGVAMLLGAYRATASPPGPARDTPRAALRVLGPLAGAAMLLVVVLR
jgi:hypothetical protein